MEFYKLYSLWLVYLSYGFLRPLEYPEAGISRYIVHYTSWPKGVVHGLMYDTGEPIRMQEIRVNQYKGE